MANCDRCSDSNSCDQCSFNYVYQPNKCQLNCDITYYRDSNGVCKKCGPNCNYCTDYNTCNTCMPTFYLQEGKCVNPCSLGYNQISQNMTCIKCTVPSCETCPATTNCTKCTSPNKVLLIGNVYTCVLNCPPEWFSPDGIVCQKCLPGCKLCEDSTTCIECTFGNFLCPTKKVCDTICPPGYAGISGKCVKCIDPNCITCTGDVSVCLACNQNLPVPPFQYVKEGKCVTECGPGFYLSPNSKLCKACCNNCLTCSDGCGTCTSCVEALTLQGTVCKNNCDPGYVEVNNVCVTCNTPFCNTCQTNQNTCIDCAAGYHLKVVDGVTYCVIDCGVGWFINSLTGNCNMCTSNCYLCNNAYNCMHCTNGWHLVQH